MDQTNLKAIFDAAEFERDYHECGPLGALYTPEATTFRLWAPTAQAVRLNLYAEGEGGAPLEQVSLTPESRGVWRFRAAGDLRELYYDYEVTADNICRSTADPYARACGINGRRSMVVDLRRTDPEGWAADRAPEPKPETVIYEIHVKDFSWAPSSGVSPEYRGKFKALCQRGTTLNGDGIHPTCLDYLKELGVTHVQLMPAFDYGSVDEAGPTKQFNWGYDPVNYNIPEGSYSTDPYHGQVRIREMKEMIQTLHQNGIRVILDVVYNHTYHLDSWLWRTVPWYHYRQKTDGTPSDGSGCGCDLASERSMCARYILDSVLYWAEEYHIDGFRFDLMGLLDVELMNRIRSELDRRYGRGEKLLFGEPWAAGESCTRPGTELSDKPHLPQLDEQVGAFCDATRDAVKGSVMEAEAMGFVNGGGLRAEYLACCVKGWAGCEGEFPVKAPAQTITYLSSHDDWTLWDRLVYTMDQERQFQRLSPELLRANRLAAAINFCCQGHLFLLSGEEFGRTKQGVKNSYASPLEINQMDWNRAWENRGLVEYYQGLIALRMQLPGLQDKSSRAGERLLEVSEPAKDCAVILLDNRGGESRWSRLLLAFSTRQGETMLTLPDGDWEMLADGDSSFRWREPQSVTGTASLAPMSALILGRR
ncbi:MAG: type I pullulanase [Candidatus Onthomonas sp.]